MTAWPRRLQEGSLYLLLALLPFSKAVIEITAVLLMAGWLCERVDPRTRADTLWRNPDVRWIRWAVAGFLGVCALSILVSSHPYQSLRALISKWGEYLFLFVVVADVCRRPAVVKRAMAVTACSALAVVTECVHQAWFLYQRHQLIQPYHASALWFYQRAMGPYDNPNDLATYLIVIIPLLVAAATLFPAAIRWACWAFSVVLIGCLVYVEAIGAWIGLLGGLAVPALRMARARWVMAAVAAIALLLSAGWLQRPHGLQESRLALSAGMNDRRVMWQAALGMIRDRPILGHGLNTFMSNYLTYWVGGERQPRYAHNCYLQVTAETGLLGLSAFLALLGSVFWRLLGCMWRMPPDRVVLIAGLMAGLAAFAIQAAVDTNFYSLRQSALFWTFAGVAIGCASSMHDLAA